MFTGIVEEVGEVVAMVRAGDSTRLSMRASVVCDGLRIGDSVAVNGCCLTVVEHSPTGFSVDVIDETLSRTDLGDLAPGAAVNLERAMQVSDRLGGHLVQGHVDGVGEVKSAPPHLAISVPAALSRYLVEKGSVTIDGVSLTVVDPGPPDLRVELIPHTIEVTSLGALKPGDRVNLEVDLIAKYVERLLGSGERSPYHAWYEGKGR